MRSTTARVALLLFCSGFCALVYQTAWLRMFRLIFGASTAASAAVLALFMAGLGFGGLLLGRRADRHPSPLGLYGNLEAGIAVLSGLSPWLVELVERIYLSLGGSAALGLAGGTAVRLLLATLVLGLPTFLMGGTLPAMARAVERASDEGRRTVGLLYAVNTLGAVLGALLTTFFALEVLGIRKTVWIAALLNVLVALVARSLARTLPSQEAAVTEEAAVPVSTEEERAPAGGRWLVPFAAGVVGFAFLLMELVWYRMLAPLLGGSSYTFGLILAIALLGIGLGGLIYGAGSARRRPTLVSFAGTCALEALFLALPFALGDRLAVLAALLRPLSGAGFLALIGVWTVVTVLVVLPAAVVAGYQFPLLIALLGAGRRRVGREVGVTYAANTVGAILGSIAGGFGLIPLLSAPGVWRLVAALLLGLAAVAVFAGLRSGVPVRTAAVPVAAGVVGLLLCLATGPSAFWRHSPIGAGRVGTAGWTGPNDIRSDIQEVRRQLIWEKDGVESSVALRAAHELAFVVNGKVDGSVRGDSPTQIMSGLVGAMLHPNPRRALVIGLGTGSTAGWLAAIPSMERVDVVELEEAIVHVAEASAPVNHQVLANPKVRLFIGDGRELLLTTSETYDVIFSEPSNPYRAGIASLFSQDFYEAVEERLRPGGIFLQWLQGYELDAQVVRTAYATLASVYPSVESWQVHRGDLLLAATREPLVHDPGRVRSRMAEEPYRTSFSLVWGVQGAEGFYSAFVATPALARAIADAESAINTDDRPILEFGFARNLGRTGLFSIKDLRALAKSRGEDRPLTEGKPLDWGLVEEMRVARAAFWDEPLDDPDPAGAPDARKRVAARKAYAQGNLGVACSQWLAQPGGPQSHLDLLLLSECLAAKGHPRTPDPVDRLRTVEPTEADFVLARWHAAAGHRAEAARHLLAALKAYRTNPWPHPALVRRVLPLALELSRQDRALAPAFYEAFSQPFSVRLQEQMRLVYRMETSKLLETEQLCAEGLAPLEPNVPWEGRILAYRVWCYERLKHPLERQARRDLGKFLADAPPNLAAGLLPEASQVPAVPAPVPARTPPPAEGEGGVRKTSSPAGTSMP
jgi:spermidine synthase